MFILDIGTVPTVCYCVLVIVISFALECYTGYTLTLQRKFSMLDGAIHKSNSTILISYYFGNVLNQLKYNTVRAGLIRLYLFRFANYSTRDGMVLFFLSFQW